MAKIKKKPNKIFRGWRWESDYTEDNHSIGVIEVKRGFVWMAPDRMDIVEYMGKRHMLAICARAICMNDQDTWEISSQFYPDLPCLIDDFEEFYFNHRTELLEGVQKQHIVDVGWVIQTYSNPRQVESDNWWQIGSAKRRMSGANHCIAGAIVPHA